jgi:hypothetical protein
MQSAVLSIADAQPFDAKGGANDWVSISNWTAPPRKGGLHPPYACSHRLPHPPQSGLSDDMDSEKSTRTARKKRHLTGAPHYRIYGL